MKLKRYTSVQRERLHKHLKKHVRAGLGYPAVADALNKQGFRAPNGALLDAKFVSNVLYRLRKKGKFRMSRKRTKKVSQPTITVQQELLLDQDVATEKATLDLVETVLTQPGLSNKQRLNLVNTLTQNISAG